MSQLHDTRRDAQSLHDRSVAMPAGARARLSGLDGRRADQLLAGSMVLLTAMKLFGFDGFSAGEWRIVSARPKQS